MLDLPNVFWWNPIWNRLWNSKSLPLFCLTTGLWAGRLNLEFVVCVLGIENILLLLIALVLNGLLFTTPPVRKELVWLGKLLCSLFCCEFNNLKLFWTGWIFWRLIKFVETLPIWFWFTLKAFIGLCWFHGLIICCAGENLEKRNGLSEISGTSGKSISLPQNCPLVKAQTHINIKANFKAMVIWWLGSRCSGGRQKYSGENVQVLISIYDHHDLKYKRL